MTCCKDSPHLAPPRPASGISPQLSDVELVTLAVLQALLGFTSEARWIRHARASMRHLFPYVPQQPGYNKRLRAARGLVSTASEIWFRRHRAGVVAGRAARAKSNRCARSVSSSCSAVATPSSTASEAPARLPRSIRT